MGYAPSEQISEYTQSRKVQKKHTHRKKKINNKEPEHHHLFCHTF